MAGGGGGRRIKNTMIVSMLQNLVFLPLSVWLLTQRLSRGCLAISASGISAKIKKYINFNKRQIF